ncbi:hypothetical protein EDB89DRAFT_1911317 [Lactarius sanguifluus]|nr:hypothetical protein EDB89DRAFT_1911317 [Lactarius sanguifluus]
MGRRPGFVVVVWLAACWLFATSAVVVAQAYVVVVVVTWWMVSNARWANHVHHQVHHQQQQDGDDDVMTTTERCLSTTPMGAHRPRPRGDASNSKTAAACLGHNHDDHDGATPVARRP